MNCINCLDYINDDEIIESIIDFDTLKEFLPQKIRDIVIHQTIIKEDYDLDVMTDDIE